MAICFCGKEIPKWREETGHTTCSDECNDKLIREIQDDKFIDELIAEGKI